MSHECESTSDNLGNGVDSRTNNIEGNQQNLTVDQKYETMIAKIQRRKQHMCSWPMQKKLLKLAIYLKCQVVFILHCVSRRYLLTLCSLSLYFLQEESCKCVGWKASSVPNKNSRVDVPLSMSNGNNFSDPCHSCSHTICKLTY